MTDQKSIPLVVIVAALALFGAQATRNSESPAKSDDPPIKAAGNGSTTTATPGPALSPREHHPFLDPLASFTSRRIEDFEFDGQQYWVKKRQPFGSRKQERNSPESVVNAKYETIETFLKPYHPEFLIAILPDPDDSRQAYWFDLWLEAMQRAIEVYAKSSDSDDGHRFVLDRYWLPWKRTMGRRTEDSDQHRSLPGLVLFRAISGEESEKPRFLAVLIVGETPISGVQRQPLRMALDLIADASGLPYSHAERAQWGPAKSVAVRIIGPTYSGSQKSLVDTLGEWSAVRWEEEARVGSAEAVDPIVDFRVMAIASAMQPQKFKEQLKNHCNVVTASVSSVTLPDAFVTKQLLAYVERLHPAEITPCLAILREGNTSLGALAYDRTRRELAGDANEKGRRFNVIDVAFPSHISIVHDEHEKAMNSDAIEEKIPWIRAFDADLRLPIDPDFNAVDVIPQFGSRMTTVVQEMLLKQILSKLKQQGVQYVLIAATDVRDKIFLASAIRENLPDAQLLLTTADSLLAHPAYRKYLRGALVASTYPLSRAGPLWQILDDERFDSTSQMQERLHVFPVGPAQSMYNATLFQMNKTAALIDYRPPQALMDGSRDHDRIDWNRPGAWISRVGEGDYFPEHFEPVPMPLRPALQPDDSDSTEPACYTIAVPPEIKPADAHNNPADASPPPQNSQEKSRQFPVSAIWYGILYFVLCVGAVVLFNAAAAIWDDRQAMLVHVPNGQLHPTAGTVDLRHLLSLSWINGLPEISSREFGRVFVLRGLLTLLVAVAAGYFAWCCSLAKTMINVCTSWMFAIIAAGSCICCLAGLVLPFRDKLLRRHLVGKPPKEMLAILYLAAVVIVALVFTLELSSVWKVSAAETEEMRRLWGRFAPFRIVSIANGLSPVFPALIFSGLCLWWIQMSLKMIDFLHSPASIFIERLAAVGGPEPFWKPNRTLLLIRLCALVPLGIVLWFVRQRWLPTSEGLLYGTLVWWLIVALVIGVGWEVIGLCWFWTRLESVHRQIVRFPLLPAFDRLPELFVAKYGSLVFPDRPGAPDSRWLGQFFKHFREQSGGDSLAKRLPKGVPSQVLSSTFRDQDPHDWVLPTSWNELFSLAADLRALLEEGAWKTRSPRDAFCAFAKEKDKSPAAPARDWEQCAEDFLAAVIAVGLVPYRLRMKHQGFFLLVAPFGLLMAINSYPFQPQSQITLLSAALMFTVMSGLMFVLTGMNRDMLLSRISKTASGIFSFDSNFMKPALIYILPTMIVVASKLPGVGDMLYSVVQPLLQALSFH